MGSMTERGPIRPRGRNRGRRDERGEVGEAIDRSARRGLPPSPRSRHKRDAQRRERDLELVVVRLDGRDLLHEKARPEQRAERARRAVAREDALDLERDRRDERQERELHERRRATLSSTPPTGEAAARARRPP